MTNLKSLRLFFVSLLFTGLTLVLGTTELKAQDAAKGADLFKANCASCHKLDKKMVGPALGGVTERREQEWLLSWIKNSQDLIKAGDEDAVAIFEEYNGSPMTAFSHFSDEQILDILAYTANPPVVEKPGEEVTGSTPNGAQGGSSTSTLLIAILILLVSLYAVVKAKNALKDAAEEEIVSFPVALKRFLKGNPGVVVVIVVLLVIGGIKSTWADVFDTVGVAQGYQPEQPIAFSHKIHAGENGIDCNYCHSSARHSKTSGIPSANVCMNCHTYINEGTQTGTTEINKIYEAVGYDPETRSYIEGYQQKPIKWIKIHNLPDLVYFNHSQHVNAGQQECQTCHGPIEEMDVVEQHSPLTMGWCIDCHRETEVDTDNPYYEHMNENWAEKFSGEKITVEKIGGTECGKCHY
jgi:mono/diheme cytochrome c family protein